MTPPREPLRIKICGITRESDAREAARLGADFLGFIFYPPSPRYIEPARAAEIVRDLRAQGELPQPRTIGVFVDEPLEKLQEVLDRAGLDGAQCHGAEPPEYVAGIRGYRIVCLSLESIERLGRYPAADLYLCDAHDPVRKGGSGKTYDYAALAPHVGEHRLMVAGGLTPESVGPMVRQLRPWGVDVSSALESAPGVKDHARMRAFVQAARQADSGAA